MQDDTISKRKRKILKTTKSDENSKRNYEKKDETNEKYCICDLPYDPTMFFIGCDKCEQWYHGKCVKINEEYSQFIDKYFCYKCVNAKSPSQGKSILKNHLENNNEIYINPLNAEDPNMYYSFNPNKSAATSRQKKLQNTKWKEHEDKIDNKKKELSSVTKKISLLEARINRKIKSLSRQNRRKEQTDIEKEKKSIEEAQSSLQKLQKQADEIKQLLGRLSNFPTESTIRSINESIDSSIDKLAKAEGAKNEKKYEEYEPLFKPGSATSEKENPLAETAGSKGNVNQKEPLPLSKANSDDSEAVKRPKQIPELCFDVLKQQQIKQQQAQELQKKEQLQKEKELTPSSLFQKSISEKTSVKSRTNSGDQSQLPSLRSTPIENFKPTQSSKKCSPLASTSNDKRNVVEGALQAPILSPVSSPSSNSQFQNQNPIISPSVIYAPTRPQTFRSATPILSKPNLSINSRSFPLNGIPKNSRVYPPSSRLPFRQLAKSVALPPPPPQRAPSIARAVHISTAENIRRKIAEKRAIAQSKNTKQNKRMSKETSSAVPSTAKATRGQDEEVRDSFEALYSKVFRGSRDFGEKTKNVNIVPRTEAISSTRKSARLKLREIPEITESLALAIEEAAFNQNNYSSLVWVSEPEFYKSGSSSVKDNEWDDLDSNSVSKHGKGNLYTIAINRVLLRLSKFKYLKRDFLTGKLSPESLVAIKSKDVNKIEKVGRFRYKCKETLKSVLDEKYAIEIENIIFRKYEKKEIQDMNECSLKVRELVFNLKKNTSVVERVKSGKISLEKLASMSEDELASPELSQWRENVNKEKLRESIREKPVAETYKENLKLQNKIPLETEAESKDEPKTAIDFFELHIPPVSTKDLEQTKTTESLANNKMKNLPKLGENEYLKSQIETPIAKEKQKRVDQIPQNDANALNQPTSQTNKKENRKLENTKSVFNENEKDKHSKQNEKNIFSKKANEPLERTPVVRKNGIATDLLNENEINNEKSGKNENLKRLNSATKNEFKYEKSNNFEKENVARPQINRKEPRNISAREEIELIKKRKAAGILLEDKNKSRESEQYALSELYQNSENEFSEKDPPIWKGAIEAYNKPHVIELQSFDIVVYQIGGLKIETLPFKENEQLKMVGRIDVIRLFEYINGMLKAAQSMKKIPVAFEIRPVDERILDSYLDFCSYFKTVQRCPVYTTNNKSFVMYMVPPDLEEIQTQTVRQLFKCDPPIGCMWAVGNFSNMNAFRPFSAHFKSSLPTTPLSVRHGQGHGDFNTEAKNKSVTSSYVSRRDSTRYKRDKSPDVHQQQSRMRATPDAFRADTPQRFEKSKNRTYREPGRNEGRSYEKPKTFEDRDDGRSEHVGGYRRVEHDEQEFRNEDRQSTNRYGERRESRPESKSRGRTEDRRYKSNIRHSHMNEGRGGAHRYDERSPYSAKAREPFDPGRNANDFGRKPQNYENRQNFGQVNYNSPFHKQQRGSNSLHKPSRYNVPRTSDRNRQPPSRNSSPYSGPTKEYSFHDEFPRRQLFPPRNLAHRSEHQERRHLNDKDGTRGDHEPGSANQEQLWEDRDINEEPDKTGREFGRDETSPRYGKRGIEKRQRTDDQRKGQVHRAANSEDKRGKWDEDPGRSAETVNFDFDQTLAQYGVLEKEDGEEESHEGKPSYRDM